jgi:hypothetical protein
MRIDIAKLRAENKKKESEFLTKSIDFKDNIKNLKIKYEEEIYKLKEETSMEEKNYLSKSIDLNSDLTKLRIK